MCCRAKGVDPKTVRRDNRRIGVLLERKVMIMNHKKLCRIWTEEKLCQVTKGAGDTEMNGTISPRQAAAEWLYRVFHWQPAG